MKLPPSPWVCRWSGFIRTKGSVLDLAAGEGRHSSYLLTRGFKVTAVDRDTSCLSSAPALSVHRVDLENEPWPLGDRQFAGVVVTNYLYRPLLPFLVGLLESNGVLIYETFMVGNERYGRPSNPDFLLHSNELLQAYGELQVLGFEQGFTSDPKLAMVQRICVRKSGPDS